MTSSETVVVETPTLQTAFDRRAYESRFGDNRLIYAICALAIVIGLALRFGTLGNKSEDLDEGSTEFTTAGILRPDKTIEFYDTYVSTKKLADLPRILPNTSPVDTLIGCAVDSPFNPPLYFLGARMWIQNIGTGIVSERAFSSAISIFEAAAFYFFALELFLSPPAAAIIAAVAFASPFNFEAGQFARPYELWIVLTLLSSALCLRATRLKTKESWIQYSVAATLSFYTHLSALRVVASHLLWGVWEKFQDKTMQLRPMLLSIGAAFVLFIPWLIQLNNNLIDPWRGTKWFEGNTAAQSHIGSWGNMIQHTFINLSSFDYSLDHSLMPICVLLAAGIIAAFVKLAPKTPRSFVLMLLAVNALTMMVPDILFGGNRSHESRYMLPCMLAFETMTGFVVAVAVSAKKKAVSLLGVALLVAIIASGLYSSWGVSHNRNFWGGDGQIQMSSDAINKCERPIIFGWKVQNGWPAFLFSLACNIKSDAYFAFSSEHKELLPIPEKATDVFLWEPTDAQIKFYNEHGMPLKQVFGGCYKLQRD